MLSAFRMPVYNARKYPLLAQVLANAVDEGDFRMVLKMIDPTTRGPKRECPPPGSTPRNGSVAEPGSIPRYTALVSMIPFASDGSSECAFMRAKKSLRA